MWVPSLIRIPHYLFDGQRLSDSSSSSTVLESPPATKLRCKNHCNKKVSAPTMQASQTSSTITSDLTQVEDELYELYLYGDRFDAINKIKVEKINRIKLKRTCPLGEIKISLEISA